MELLFLFVLGALIFYVLLYFVIKYAVKYAILEAHWEINKGTTINDEEADNENIGYDIDGGDRIAKIVCQKCGRKYDMDYPKCPYCG